MGRRLFRANCAPAYENCLRVDNCRAIGIFAAQSTLTGTDLMVWPHTYLHLVAGRARSTRSFYTWRKGELVGEDEFGNRYYRTRGGAIDPTLGFQRRWVIYNGYAGRLGDADRLVWLAAS